MKKIVGYVRSIPGGEGLADVPVSIRLKKDGTLVPTGGIIQASINPVNTDADGRFEWQCELSPGPLKVEAAIDSTTELKVRMGEEVMQAGDIFISDITSYGKMFTDGVIDDIGGELVATAVTGALQVTIATGVAIMNGRIFSLDTSRTMTIAPNPSLVTRKDVVYIEQVLTGLDTGKQNIVVLQGTVNDTIPAIPVEAGVTRIGLAQVTVPQGATSVTVLNVAPMSSPTNSKLDEDQVLLVHLAPEVENQLLSSMFTITTPTNDQRLEYNGSKWVNRGNTLSGLTDTTISSPAANQVLTYSSGSWKNLALPTSPTYALSGLSGVTITSPVAGQVLTYSGGVWKNLALPAAPTVSIAAATDTVITSPANNQFLVYSAGKWRNADLTIDIPSAKFAQSVYSAYGNLPSNNVLLASCAVTVPAGTWLLKVEAMGSFYGINTGGGSNNFWFQGNAVETLSLTHTQVTETSDQGVDRGWSNTCGRVVTVSATTTFTADLWVSGGNIYLRGGKIVLMAV